MIRFNTFFLTVILSCVGFFAYAGGLISGVNRMNQVTGLDSNAYLSISSQDDGSGLIIFFGRGGNLDGTLIDKAYTADFLNGLKKGKEWIQVARKNNANADKSIVDFTDGKGFGIDFESEKNGKDIEVQLIFKDYKYNLLNIIYISPAKIDEVISAAEEAIGSIKAPTKNQNDLFK